MAASDIVTVEKGGDFEAILAGYAEQVQDLARGARALLAEVMPGLTEVTWVKQRIAGYGVGPKKMSEQFCYIAPFKAHVNLGFYYGSELPDPAGLLGGSGKVLRHVKLSAPEQVARPELRKLIEAASRYLPRLES